MSEHRLNIVKAAISDFPEFEVSDIEYKLEGKSYTCNTIVELYKRNKIDGKINFLIGTDAFRKIESWYRTDDLKKLVDFVVFIRENNFESDELEYLRSKGYNFKFMPQRHYVKMPQVPYFKHLNPQQSKPDIFCSNAIMCICAPTFPINSPMLVLDY